MTRTLGPDLAPAVAAIERLMDDDCVIARPGAPTGRVNPTNGRPMLGPAGEVYAGPCLVASGNPTDMPAERGGVVAPVDETNISIPLGAPLVPTPGDLVVITGSRRDPDLTGRVFKVLAIPYKSFAISRKLRVEVQPGATLDTLGLPALLPAPSVPAGAASGDQAFVENAAEALSGHRVVVVGSSGARYADPADVNDAWGSMAVTLGAAAQGQPVTLASEGEIEEPSWSWASGRPVFVGSAGILTQATPTAPSSAWLRVVGVATSPTEIRLAFGPPISLI